VELIGQLSNPGRLPKLQKLVAMTGSTNTRPPMPNRSPRQRQRKLSPERIEDLAQAYQGGASMMELAATYELHRATVVDHLERAGVSRRRTPLADVDTDELWRLYAKGWSLKRIGDHFGVRPTSVYYRLRRAGVVLRPRNGWSTGESSGSSA
jgi:predicted DNA-binding protein YlxM (UPF0122 family)